MLQISGRTSLHWFQKEKINLSKHVNESFHEEGDWENLDADVYHWTRSLRPVQVQKSCGFAEVIYDGIFCSMKLNSSLWLGIECCNILQ